MRAVLRSTVSARTCGFVAVAAAAGLAIITPIAISADAASAATATVTSWADLTTAFTGTGTVTLGADITAPAGQQLALASGDDVGIDLNGHSLTIAQPSDHQAAIEVPPGATFAVLATGGGTLTVTGGGDGVSAGAGVGGAGATAPGAAESCGTVVILGGTISATGGSTSSGGGGAGIGGGGGLRSFAAPGGGDGCTLAVSGGIVTGTGGRAPSATGASIGGGSGSIFGPGGAGGSVSLQGTGTPGTTSPGYYVINGGQAAPATSTVATPNTYFRIANIDGTGTIPSSTTITYSYDVAYDSQGGSAVAGSTADYGTAVTAPNPPTRAGFTFQSWRTGSATGAVYAFGSPLVAPLTLVATWSAAAAAPAAAAPAAADADPGLVATGVDAGSIALVGAVLVGAGVGALLVTRRRRTRTHG